MESTTTKDRNADGTFAEGNGCGRGNPFAGRVAKIRKIFFETITDDDMHEMTQKLIEIAKEGDFRALKFILTYLLGKPGSIHESDAPFIPLMASGMFDEVFDQALSSPPATRELPPLSAADLMAPGKQPPSTNGVFENPSDIRIVQPPNKQKRVDKDRRRKK